jgi:hypothetical protein
VPLRKQPSKSLLAEKLRGSEGHWMGSRFDTTAASRLVVRQLPVIALPHNGRSKANYTKEELCYEPMYGVGVVLCVVMNCPSGGCDATDIAIVVQPVKDD